MKYNYDWAAEMVKIAESAEHLNSMEKLAFSREGKEEVSEVEEEMRKLASGDCSCKDDCDCQCKDGCDCDCDCSEGEKKEASVSLEDTAGLLLEISTELEDQGMDRLAAATIVLADNILKTAAAKKSPGSSSSSSSKSSDKSDKKSDKKMSMKERMEKMRAAQKGKKGKSKKTEDKSSKKK